jgi:hypothetical protein
MGLNIYVDVIHSVVNYGLAHANDDNSKRIFPSRRNNSYKQNIFHKINLSYYGCIIILKLTIVSLTK